VKRRLFLGTMAAGAVPRKRWLLGANTAVQGYGLYEAIDLLRRLEFPVIEIHPMGRMEPTPKVFPGFRFDALGDGEKKRLREALRPFRQVTTHLPYTGLNWMSGDREAREKAVRTVDIALEGSAYFGATMAVLHPQPLENWRSREGEYMDAIRRWGERGKALGVRIGVETGFPQSVDEFVGLVNGLGHSHIGATIDVGHQGRYKDLQVRAEDRALPASVKAYNDTTAAIIERLGRKVFHVHVHDIDPETWVEHKPMVHGFVDYPRLLGKLEEAGYRGCLVLEIGGDPGRMPEYLRAAREKLRGWLG
jgi:sugar phosphate isomerase/epimerase